MHINWAALAEVLVAGLVTGVGTVVLFALGVRGWSEHADARQDGRTSALGVATAVVSFGLCVLMVGFGIFVIVNR